MRSLPVLLFALTLVPSLGALPALDEGHAARTAENYQKAIEFYRQAKGEAPEDPAPARALAELFTEKGLHSLALPEWQEAVRKAPGDLSSWISLAQTWSYLDDNPASVRTLEQARERFPQSVDVAQALAWMLFKTEDFRRGIDFLEAFVAQHGTDRSLEMTLGTLYSSVFDYGLSRVHYLKSIELAPGSGSTEKNFRSIAWYNLSLLEKGWYQFERADEAIRQSLQEEDRPAGSLALGELFQSRRDFSEARRLYEKAVQTDETPLARFDLARLLQEFGYLDDAEAQLSRVETHKDETWIYNYGVTKDKVRRDLFELRANIHKSRWHRLDFQPRTTPWDWIAWAGAKVKEGAAWWYYDQSWKALLVKLSSASMAARNSPEAWVGLTLAHRDRPSLALKYLALVRNHELARNPRSQGAYLVEEGVLNRDPRTLRWALDRTQVPWENEDRERALATLVEVARSQGQAAEARRWLVQLYAVNPGGLPVRGWGIPVRVRIFGDPAEREPWKTAWQTYTGQSGWDAGFDERPGVEWTLEWQVLPGAVAWTLRDAEGTILRSGGARVDQRMPVLASAFAQLHGPP